MSGLKKIIERNAIYRLYEPYLPGDHHRPWSAADYARELLAKSTGPVRLLDLGCGAGESMDFFSRLHGQCLWHGAEVAASPELRAAGHTGRPITFFDGVRLPWDDGLFDVVYSSQVLEHVRRPGDLLADVFRVLKPGGFFAGSVSYLEPYHSLSLFNYTPYGLITVLNDAGFRIRQLRPGQDCCRIILRQLAGGSAGLSGLLGLFSPVKAAAGVAGLLCGFDHKVLNFIRIQFAGHLCFLACKEPAPAA